MKNFFKLTLLFAFFCFHQMASAQEKTIKGTVTDANTGAAIIGALVKVPGTNTGAITDVEGNFVIRVPEEVNALLFSFLGYKSITQPLGNDDTLNIKMAEDVKVISGVVINALGLEKDKNKLGSTSAQISSDDAIRSGEGLFINSLAGKASGLKISRANGDPGAGSTIQLRGFSSIGGDYQPLIILDGIPISNSNLYGSASRSGGTSQQSRLNDINPHDIESINVLKGASAAALWGSRAANGVIVITTKGAKKGGNTFSIELSSSISVDEINIRHPLQTSFGQGTGGKYDPKSRGGLTWGDKISDRTGGADDVDMSGEYFDANNGVQYYKINTKNSRDIYTGSNFDAVFNTGYTYDNNITIAAGSEKSSILFSLSHLNQEGIVLNSSYKRITARVNYDYRFNDFLSINSKANYSNVYSNRIQQSSNTTGLYLGLLRTPPDFDISGYRGNHVSSSGLVTQNRQRSYRSYLGSRNNPTYNNPLWTVNEQKSPNSVNRLIFSSELKASPLSNFDILLRGGLDTYTDKRQYFFPEFSANSERSLGQYTENIFQSTDLNVDILGIYATPLTPNIHFDATVGWNYNSRNRLYNYSRGQDVLVNAGDFFNFVNYSTVETSNSLRRILSNRGYALLGFDFFEQIFLNLSGTLEAASTIKDTFFYSSADIAWQFTKLPLFANSRIINFGKLRFSYGQVGVQPDPYRFDTTYESFSYDDYDGGLAINQFGGGYRLNDDKGNIDIRPEIKTEFEIGADLSLFQDKFVLGFTYYSNNTKDVLIDVGLPNSTGFNNIYENAAVLENKGIEFDFDASLYKKNDWDIGLYGNFNRNRNQVLDLKGTSSIVLDDVGSIDSRAVVGHQLGVLFGTLARRNADGSLDLDANGYPRIAVGGVQGVIGDPNPDWRGGLGLRFSYKKLAINILFEHSQGGDFAERTRFILARFGTHADVGNEVTLTKDMTNISGKTYTAGTTVRGNLRDFGAGDVILDEDYYNARQGFGDSVINEFAIADATWTRLREVSFSYRIASQKFKEKTKLSAIDITVTGRNLMLWTDIVGIDPEINQGGVSNGFGVEYFTNPSTKSWVISLKITY